GFDDLKARADLATNNQRVQMRATLLADLRERLAPYTAGTLSKIFEKHGLPFAPIARPEDVYDDAHLNETGGLAEIEVPDGAMAGQSTRVPLLALVLGGNRLGVRESPPRLGQHSDSLLQELGYGQPEIQRLRSAGMIR